MKLLNVCFFMHILLFTHNAHHRELQHLQPLFLPPSLPPSLSPFPAHAKSPPGPVSLISWSLTVGTKPICLAALTVRATFRWHLEHSPVR